MTVRNLSLDYGEFRALKNIRFSLAPAEIHAIVGEHGAGKSSLGMIISGIRKPHAGALMFNGHEYRFLTVKAAGKLGIEMVHQHTLSLNRYFTIAENLALANMPIFTGQKATIHAVEAFFAQHGVTLDPATLVEKLNVSDQIFVDILKHIYPKPRLLILDEALEKLTAPAFNKVVQILTALKHEGTSILLITHRIDDIYSLADRVSIIKNGEILLTDAVKNIDKINLIKMAYTQLSTDQPVDNLNTEFYQFLKYNEAILRNLPVNLIVTDNKRRIKMVNEYGRQYFRLHENLYLNVPVEQFFAGDNADILKLLETAFASSQETSFYQVPVRVNDQRAITNIKTFPIYDGAFLLGHILILEDMTEYDQLQKQVMLSEKLASVG
ncbi:MAG: ATP-binding cassette domain-containing protein, partial [Smithellaceae bacterium]